jgi:hypothetical protein
MIGFVGVCSHKIDIGHSYAYSIAANVTTHSWSVVAGEGCCRV